MTTALQGNDAAQHISEAVPQSILSVEENLIFVSADAIVSICEFLKSDSRYAFDFLEAISAVDMIDHFQVVYHLLSLSLNQTLVLKIQLYGRDDLSLPSISGVWKAADFQEREIYDLNGITFVDHPNMKRILTWDGFDGHPLRKDFL
ncbi:MAG: NADH-quinone oxidoreductase subunit C [SAR202 cluster bacterium]|nr:NADH-quinone oxidoreductase subunit C [SAR202 cluster bacterium]|tara:strand:- start:175 stop:615 length:441 start_codon:yes stop_codon:yes gene_type:complete